MPRIRTIKPEFFTDEDVADLPPLIRLFFVGIWCHADKAGRLKYKPRQLKVQILPFDDIDGEAAIEQLVKARLLIRYESQGETYLQVRTWYKHQRPHHTERDSDIPPLDNGVATVIERTEGKGKEGNGKEGDNSSEPVTATEQPDNPNDNDPSLMEFEVTGPVKVWHLRKSLATTLMEAYPDLDRKAEYLKAKAWLKANPRKRKTARGMPKFLNSWLDRAQNRPGSTEAHEPVDIPYKEH